ncbi:MAG: hypothetical protein KatS3mg031_0812 [Chitinophagales bacterium]|nr:MAG: hypothetical protein KatS3mg031_0812 [Chitinophagales bacterium]
MLLLITTTLLLGSLLLSAQESPVQGDDLLKCLGQPRNSEYVSKLNAFIGNKEPKEEISFLNYGKGIQVNIERSIVKSIDLYNSNNPYSAEFKRFPGELPLGISFNHTIFQVKQRIGEGYETSGEVDGAFQLIKIFKLNENDDYKMVIEFNVGRMVVMSLSYIEGGAGGADTPEKVEAAMAGFKGNDFFTMMRKNQYNLEYGRFRDLLGLPTYYSRTRQLFADKGVDVLFNSSGSIESITLYAGGQPTGYKDYVFKPYELDLPFGIRMENTRQALLKKLGEPASADGNLITYNERYALFQIAFKGDKIDYVRIAVDHQRELPKGAPSKPYVPKQN